MKIGVIDTNTLVEDVHSYLRDAGFGKNLYKIEDFNNRRQYVEVFFICAKAIDYIKYDIKNSEYSELLEIKKYRHNDDTYSAIITYIY